MKKQAKHYTGTACIGVVGPETEIGECRDSIEMIGLRPGDDRPAFARGTKGYEGRQILIDKFMDSKHDWLLLLDHDMVFAPDTLERLRSHGLPFVSGFYMRRTFLPIAPVWFEPWNGKWPFVPFTKVPEPNKLYKIGASGWGCALIHREVFTTLRQNLHREWEVAEDDMDVWPYDLPAIMGAVRGLRELADTKPGLSTLRPALEAHTATLEREIRPLRGSKDVVGSDIRFGFYARAAGYQLWGDSGVSPQHMLNYPLSADDYTQRPPEELEDLTRKVKKGLKEEQARVKVRLDEAHGVTP